MGSPIGKKYPEWLKHWIVTGYKPREARYYNQLYVARPKWANQKKIQAIYTKCKKQKKQGINVVVDHIIPLCNPYVCGLMCEDNLQIITCKENELKSNTTWPDSWNEHLELKLEKNPHQMSLEI